MKHFSIPTPSELRAILGPLEPPALERLGSLSGVSKATLLKIKAGAIKDPGIVTVAAFLPHVRIIRKVFVDPAKPIAVDGVAPAPLVPRVKRSYRRRNSAANADTEQQSA